MSSKKKMRQKPTLKDKRSKSGKKKKSKNIENLPATSKREALIEQVGKKEAKRLRQTKKQLKEVEKLGGQFSRDMGDIFELLDENDNDATKVQVIFLKSALAAIIDLIPHMEAQARKSKREQEMYALNSLISQGREIFADLRSVSDSSLVADRIAVAVVDPMFTAMSHTFITLIASLRDTLLEHVKDDAVSRRKVAEEVMQCGMSFGTYLNTSSATLKEAIRHEID